MKRLLAKVLLTLLMLPEVVFVLVYVLLAGCFLLDAAAEWFTLRQAMRRADVPLSVCLADVELAAEIPGALRVCFVAPQDRERVAAALSKRKDWTAADGQTDWDALIASYIPNAAGLLRPSGIDLWTSDREGFALWDTEGGVLLLGDHSPAYPGESRDPLERMGLVCMADALDAVPVLKQPVDWAGEAPDMRVFLVPAAHHPAIVAAMPQAGWTEVALSGTALTRLQQRYLPALDALTPPPEVVFDWWAFVPEDVSMPSVTPDEAFTNIGDWDAAFYDQDSGLFLWYRSDY